MGVLNPSGILVGPQRARDFRGHSGVLERNVIAILALRFKLSAFAPSRETLLTNKSLRDFGLDHRGQENTEEDWRYLNPGGATFINQYIVSSANCVIGSSSNYHINTSTHYHITHYFFYRRPITFITLARPLEQ